jgi:hypothetical protein
MANQDTILSPYFIYPFLENFYGLVVGSLPKNEGFSWVWKEAHTWWGGKGPGGERKMIFLSQE